MTLPIRVENDEIPSFITRCAVDALQWEVEGRNYEQWSIDHKGEENLFSTWRDDVIIPYLQQQFEALEVHEDGRLYGIRRDTEEEIDQGFYIPNSLSNACSLSVPDRDGGLL
jgi:hypothetical protein